ncbi:lysozyme [Anaeramoeba ignava]|uniref:Lysozyme n=1 Tax=Anaeramoeba ignava TaxID=1746090 RepID=A0A9Q0LNS8_ANAIG|nr:lysozyme [Anaeramoeba ignava]
MKITIFLIAIFAVAVVYSISECDTAKYLENAGFSSTQVPVMVCIAKYESSYNCGATHDNTDGSEDFGLFQINSYWWCSGGPISKYDGCHNTCQSMFSCQTNANCARVVYEQQGYTAWYAYRSHKSECDSFVIHC